MKKKIIFLQSLMFILFERAYAVNKVSCGTVKGIPEGMPGFVKTIVTLIELLVPLALILFGSVDFLKVIFSEDKKGLDKAVKKFITRSGAGVAIFFVTFVTLLIFRNLNNGSNTVECVKCFAIDKEYCTVYYEADEDHTAEKEKDNKEREELEKEREKNREKNEEDANKEKEEAAKEKDPDHILNGSKSPSSSTSEEPVTISEGTLVQSEYTDTLKVSFYKVGSYYVTSMWVKDPYNQMGKFDSPEYGSKLYKPSELLKKAISQKNMNDDLVVGFNASGFYLAGTYDPASVSAYPDYDKTSVGTLVITDGKEVRNAYQYAVKTWYVAGVDKTNTLRIYEDTKTTDANAKLNWSKEVKSHLKNTYTFASPLVENGVASSKTTSMPQANDKVNRQAICQIDEHNFILITGGGLNRQDLINIMLKYKCKTGTNFDGGGSIALLYKSRTSSSVEKMIGDNRALTEVGYFRGSGTSSLPPTPSTDDGTTHTNSKTGIVYKIYNQADSRWGSLPYSGSNDTVKSRGCMITSAAVVSSSYDSSITPKTVYDKYLHTGPRESIPKLTKNNYSCSYGNTSKESVANYLKAGKVVVIMVWGEKKGGNSSFTTSQHYMALIDIDSSGNKAFVGNASGSGTGKHAAAWFNLNDLLVSVQTTEVCTPSRELINRYQSSSGTKNIYIGDSRTVGMCASLSGGDWIKCQYNNSGGYDYNGELIISQGSMGYSWLVNTAIPKVNSIIAANPGVKYNIISLMGVNGLDASNYVSKYTELADGAWKNQNIVLVSVNPIDYEKELQHGYSVKQESIISFNNRIQSVASSKSNVKYCDTYNLIINDFNTTDGLHYDGNTYKKIYNGIKGCL